MTQWSDPHSVHVDHFPGRPHLRRLPDPESALVLRFPSERTGPATASLAADSAPQAVSGASSSYDVDGLLRLFKELCYPKEGA